MGSDNPKDKGNPPPSTFPLVEHNEFGFPVSHNGGTDCNELLRSGNNAGADLMSFPYMSLPVNPFLAESTDPAYPSCAQNIPATRGVSMCDFMSLSNSQLAPQIDLSLQPSGSNMHRNLNPSALSFPQQMLGGINQSTNDGHTFRADNFLNSGTGAQSFQNPQGSRNFVLTRDIEGGNYHLNRYAGEANSSVINRPQSNRQFVNLGGGRPMLHHMQNNGDMKAENNVKVNADQIGSQENIDGSFLSLGLGGNAEARSAPYFSSQEISDKLEESYCPGLSNSHLRHSTRSYSSLSHNSIAFPSSQSVASGLSIPTPNVGGLTSGHEVGVVCGANNTPSSSPFLVTRMPQNYLQQNINPMQSNMTLGASQTDANYGELDLSKGFQGDQHVYSGAYISNPTSFVSSRQNRLPGLAAGSDNPTWVSTGTALAPQRYMEISKNISLQSPLYTQYFASRGRSGGQGYSGQLSSAHEGTVAPSAGSNLYPNTNQIQTTGNNAAESMEGGVFPQRLGVQVLPGSAAQASAISPLPKEMGIQAASKVYRPQHSVPVQFRREFLGPPRTIGQPEAMRMQSCTDLRVHPTIAGHPQNSIPVQYRRLVSSSGEIIPVARVHEAAQVSDVLGRPSLKRGAVQTPGAPQVQRRKLTPKPPIHPFAPYQPRKVPAPFSVPASPISTLTPAVDHIKWQDLDVESESTGEKCLLCKRDLTFSPEGPVQKPHVPPSVAVLPCSHTFHDHCLQLITPDDQAKNPPCIPCAIGDK